MGTRGAGWGVFTDRSLSGPYSAIKESRNKRRAVSQGAWKNYRSAVPLRRDEHLQKPCNAGSRPEAPFINSFYSLGVMLPM